MRLLLQVVFMLYVHHAASHLCLITPHQRGPLDISMAGSHTCTRHQLPCGGQPIEDPAVTYAPGETVFFKWQQNYNHYEVGYPGYMDLAIAPTAQSTNFTTLFVVADKYVHAQDYQENITAIIKLPNNMECDHCVIRARYNAHKPGETPFLQCTDIKISAKAKKSNTLKFSSNETPSDRRKILPLKRALKLKKATDTKYNWNTENDDVKLYGFAYNPFEPQRSHYISVGTTTGKTETINMYDFGIDSPAKDSDDMTFMMDELIAIDNARNTSYVLIHKEGSRDDTAKMLYNIGSTNGSVFQMSPFFDSTGGPINALSWYTFGTSAAFRIQPDQSGSWIFEVGTLDFGGIYTKRAAIPKPEGLYVNFQWFETNIDNYHTVYALLGNENAPDELNARIYVFDLYEGKYLGNTELDVSEYTFMSFHAYPNSKDVLYAFSPGLWFNEIEAWAWSLVVVDTVKGTVKKQCDIAPLGIFERYYGGSVYQGSTNNDGFLYHVLRVQGSEADFVVAVNPITCETRFSDVTNLRHIHSLQKLSQPT